jgi:hypothetical protein
LRWNNRALEGRLMKNILLMVLLLLSVFCGAVGLFSENVGVNIVVVNPSDEKTQEVAVNYELPPGLQRGDIIETGSLKVEYDVTSAVFYVAGTIELNPKETKTVKVVIRDIWKIPNERISHISEMIDGKAKVLEGEVDPQALELAVDDLRSRLEDIKKYQEDNAGDVQKRMEMYTSNLDKMRRIERDIFSIESLLDPEGGAASDSDENVVLNIEASNTSDEDKILPVRYDLPREVIPQHIDDTGKMEIRHDPAKDIFYMFFEGEFTPLETKRFQIRIKNVWKISENEINGYINEAEEVHAKFAGLPEERTADILLASIKRKAETIITSQQSSRSIKDRIAIFRENQKILRELKDDLEKLKSMTIPEIDQEKLELSSVLRSEKIFETLKELSDRLFKEKITAATVWRIVLLVVIFAMILTAVFYAIWTIRVKKDEARDYDKIQ